VKVRCDEGLAIHVGPEPCACLREEAGEASAGERTGQPLSRENSNFLGADAIDNAEGKTSGRAIASAWMTRRGRRNLACADALCTGTGRSHVWPAEGPAGPHREGEEP
jgi:hypothetical protein